MTQKLRVIIQSVDRNDIYIQRPAASSMDRDLCLTLNITEVDDLVQLLQSVRVELASRKRAAAERLLQEANELVPPATT